MGAPPTDAYSQNHRLNASTSDLYKGVVRYLNDFVNANANVNVNVDFVFCKF